MELQRLLYYQGKWCYSTVLKIGDRLYYNKICDALDNLELVQCNSFQRGHSHYVFTENTHKYCIAGVQPNHAKTGISSQTFHFSNKTGISSQTYHFSNMSNHHQDNK